MKKSIPNEIRISVRQVTQPIGSFFTASMDARTLVDISFSDIRRMEDRDIEKYLGIQRPLDKSRVKKIRQYIQSKDATFPTAIIIAVDEKCAEYDEENHELILHPYLPTEDSEDSIIPEGRIAKVLDGQHRLAGFLTGDDDNRTFDFGETFDVNVSIFIGIDISEQAKIFATVNLAQTKVNKSLVYDLEDLAKSRSPFKTCHHIAVALDKNSDSPFHERIKRLGVATPGRNYEPLTQASFVEALVKFISDNPIRDRNDIIAGRKMEAVDFTKHPFREHFELGQKGDLIIYDIIFNYFEAVKKKWPKAWSNIGTKGNLLPRANAFKALMKYLQVDVYPELHKGDITKIPSSSEFSKAFSHITLSDDDFITKNFVPGGGGQSTFYKLLKGEIAAKDLLES